MKTNEITCAFVCRWDVTKCTSIPLLSKQTIEWYWPVNRLQVRVTVCHLLFQGENSNRQNVLHGFQYADGCAALLWHVHRNLSIFYHIWWDFIALCRYTHEAEFSSSRICAYLQQLVTSTQKIHRTAKPTTICCQENLYICAALLSVRDRHAIDALQQIDHSSFIKLWGRRRSW